MIFFVTAVVEMSFYLVMKIFFYLIFWGGGLEDQVRINRCSYLATPLQDYHSIFFFFIIIINYVCVISIMWLQLALGCKDFKVF